jgi:hypothetical protein
VKLEDHVDYKGIILLACFFVIPILFPGKNGGLWILGIIPLAGFIAYLVYGFDMVKSDFKKEPLKAIFTFLFILFLGSGLLALSLFLFGLIDV